MFTRGTIHCALSRWARKGATEALTEAPQRQAVAFNPWIRHCLPCTPHTASCPRHRFVWKVSKKIWACLPPYTTRACLPIHRHVYFTGSVTCARWAGLCHQPPASDARGPVTGPHTHARALNLLHSTPSATRHVSSAWLVLRLERIMQRCTLRSHPRAALHARGAAVRPRLSHSAFTCAASESTSHGHLPWLGLRVVCERGHLETLGTCTHVGQRSALGPKQVFYRDLHACTSSSG